MQRLRLNIQLNDVDFPKYLSSKWLFAIIITLNGKFFALPKYLKECYNYIFTNSVITKDRVIFCIFNSNRRGGFYDFKTKQWVVLSYEYTLSFVLDTLIMIKSIAFNYSWKLNFEKSKYLLVKLLNLLHKYGVYQNTKDQISHKQYKINFCTHTIQESKQKLNLQMSIHKIIQVKVSLGARMISRIKMSGKTCIKEGIRSTNNFFLFSPQKLLGKCPLMEKEIVFLVKLVMSLYEEVLLIDLFQANNVKMAHGCCNENGGYMSLINLQNLES